MSKLITVDTDNAIVTVHVAAAGALADQLRKDAAAIAEALSYVSGATFRVVVAMKYHQNRDGSVDIKLVVGGKIASKVETIVHVDPSGSVST